MNIELRKVLVITKDKKVFSDINTILTTPLFYLEMCNDINLARRKTSDFFYDIVIIDSTESDATELAIDISESPSSIILLVPDYLFDDVSYKVEIYGILTLVKPFDTFYFYSFVKIALAVEAKVQRYSFQTIKLKEKMEEIRLVNRAKIILIEKRKMSEQEAHHFLEKEAMDKCIKRIEVAKQIIAQE